MKFNDLTGKTFNQLTCLRVIGKNERGRTLWECQCSCGTKFNSEVSNITSGHVKSCGCAKNSTKPKDLTGKIYGHLEVVEKAKNIGPKTAWKCLCKACGSYCNIKGNNLQLGKAKSCGCQVNYNKSNLVGMIFGRLTVLEQDKVNSFGHKTYKCLCECGKEIIVDGTNLTKSITSSCGCLRSEISSKRMSLLTGSKSYSWKGGVTSEGQKKSSKERNLAKRWKWKKEVHLRDGYVCQCCKKHQDRDLVKLNAHHMDNFKDFPDKRSDPNNGITLCVACHQKFHTTYGFKNNTKAQMDNFLKTVVDRV